LLTNVTFYVNKIDARVVLPDHILKNKAVVVLVGGSHGPYTDNLCSFRCLAVHRGAPNVTALETPAKTYYRQYLQKQIRVITKLPNSEQSYKGKVKTHNYINRQNQTTTGKL
jgi:hypothetical protein